MNMPRDIKSYYVLDTTDSLQDKLSRYSNLKRVVCKDGKEYIETPNKPIIQETNKDSFYSVEKGLENRIDLISNKFYGTPLLWWAIAYMNHISNPLKVESGIVLRIPAIESIYNSNMIQV